MNLTVSAIPFTQRKFKMYVAVLPVERLDKCDVDVWNPKSVAKARGYQRQVDEKRVKAIAKFFERADGILPVAGLLNVREKGRLRFSGGRLTIPSYIKLWVVDMQHRLNGLLEAHQNGAFKKKTFEVPVVITEGLSAVSEAAQFYVINTKAKRMDVALTRRLLIENNQVNDIADVKEWEILAVTATIELNGRLQSPWKGAIRPPNTAKLEEHIATEKSFVSSLKLLFSPGHSRQSKKTAKRLAAFWTAIQANIPDAFDDPRRYLIQRTPGLFAFNYFIAPEFFAKFKSERAFEAKLAGLKKLGAEFWRRKNKHGAKKFGTGMGGYAELAAHIRKYLPL